MSKIFFLTGACDPQLHYMADTTDKIVQIARMVERGDYFTINRARQYGKTTTLRLLDFYLTDRGYQCLRISFEAAMGEAQFADEGNFCQTLLGRISRWVGRTDPQEAILWNDSGVTSIDQLDLFISERCQGKKVVLMIDECDKASNNYMFLRFIGMLRDKYISRLDGGLTFQSVILAGVYDIRNLKVKLIQAGLHMLQDGEKRINSPWNIAAQFKVDMSLSTEEIAAMLQDYERDHHTGMDIQMLATELRTWTNGYPFLVSTLCKTIDEDLEQNWTHDGLQKAVKLLIQERNLLFDDINKNLENYEDLNQLVEGILLKGHQMLFSENDPLTHFGVMFGFFANANGKLAISNPIFEQFLYERYVVIAIRKSRQNMPVSFTNPITETGEFNMPLCLERFMIHYWELYHKQGEKFLEDECRMLFLTFLKPLINGVGFYHIESQTRDSECMDIVVDYKSEQFIVELKLWYGNAAHQKALDQLWGYLDRKNASTGYLLTFDFRKEQNVGKPTEEWIEWKGKKIFDCMVGR
jgi:hypothetical protein